MTTTTLVDRVKIVVSSSGTGPFVLGPAVPAYRGVEALIDGVAYNYATELGSQYEVGTGVYVASSNTLVRSPQISSNGGAAISFPANIELSFTVLAADILPPGSLPIVQTTGTATDKAMSQNAVSEALAALSASVTGKVDLATVTAMFAILNSENVQASEAIAANDFVNIYSSGGAARVRKANANDPAKFANGYATAAIASGDTGRVFFTGTNPVTVATAASEVWLSDATPGAWVATPPSAAGSIIQPLGAAIPSVGINFSIRERVLL